MSEWGLTSGGVGTGTAAWNYYQGGTSPNLDNLQLDSFDLRINAAATDFRAAVYTGGLTTDMSTAVLLEDLGVQTSVNAGDVLNFPSATNPSIPKNTLIWLAFKADNVGLYREASAAPQDDITVVRRYFDTGDRVPSVAFPTNPPDPGALLASYVWDTVINYTVVAAGPTLTGPDTTTVDATRTVTGTALDTATTAGLKISDDSYSKTLTITPIDTVSFSQEDEIDAGIALGTPVASLPVEADVLAAGATPWQIQQWVDDGVNPEVARNITLNYLAAHTTVQAMIATANTTPGESLQATNIIAVEDDMQHSGPNVVDTVTITRAADGTLTTDKDQTISFTERYWSPSTGQASIASVTVKGSAIISLTGITRSLTRSLTRSITRAI